MPIELSYKELLANMQDLKLRSVMQTEKGWRVEAEGSNRAVCCRATLKSVLAHFRCSLDGFDILGSCANPLTLVEARYQRCRKARSERYLAVVEFGRQGHTQLQIAEKAGVTAGTVAHWLHAPGFPERRIRSDRRRDRACCLQDRERGLQPDLTRTHFSAGRMAALLLTPPETCRQLNEPIATAFCGSAPLPIRSAG
jgi:hypothetical protein